MKIPTHNFNRLAPPRAAKKPKENKQTPFSPRLTFEERAQLEQDAADTGRSRRSLSRCVGTCQQVCWIATFRSLNWSGGSGKSCADESRLTSEMEQVASRHYCARLVQHRCARIEVIDKYDLGQA